MTLNQSDTPQLYEERLIIEETEPRAPSFTRMKFTKMVRVRRKDNIPVRSFMAIFEGCELADDQRHCVTHSLFTSHPDPGNSGIGCSIGAGATISNCRFDNNAADRLVVDGATPVYMVPHYIGNGARLSHCNAMAKLHCAESVRFGYGNTITGGLSAKAGLIAEYYTLNKSECDLTLPFSLTFTLGRAPVQDESGWTRSFRVRDLFYPGSTINGLQIRVSEDEIFNGDLMRESGSIAGYLNVEAAPGEKKFRRLVTIVFLQSEQERERGNFTLHFAHWED